MKRTSIKEKAPRQHWGWGLAGGPLGMGSGLGKETWPGGGSVTFACWWYVQERNFKGDGQGFHLSGQVQVASLTFQVPG